MFRLVGCVVLFLVSLPASAQWVLDREKSSLTFTSIKANEIGEIHHFKDFDAQVGTDGQFELSVDLTSVETNVDIRNQRMQKYLFEVVNFPRAVIRGNVDLGDLPDQPAGTVVQKPLEAKVSLHGQTAPVETDLIITALGNGQAMVTPAAMILVNTYEYGMSDGVAKLMELAGLPSITEVVPVSFTLVFKPEA